MHVMSMGHELCAGCPQALRIVSLYLQQCLHPQQALVAAPVLTSPQALPAQHVHATPGSSAATAAHTAAAAIDDVNHASYRQCYGRCQQLCQGQAQLHQQRQFKAGDASTTGVVCTAQHSTWPDTGIQQLRPLKATSCHPACSNSSSSSSSSSRCRCRCRCRSSEGCCTQNWGSQLAPLASSSSTTCAVHSQFSSSRSGLSRGPFMAPQGFPALNWSSRNGFSSSSSSSSSRAYSSRAMPVSAGVSSILEELYKLREGDAAQGGLTPAAVVQRLDRVIIGQEEAKKAVAIAFRNRWRRQRVADPEMRREITPKNLLLIGPTGCGKTEIARRLAKLAEAPFIKVEATKFTEVGYHGRDVDQIIRDLVEASIAVVKKRCKKAAAKMIADAVEQAIVGALTGPNTTTAEEQELRRKYRAGELDQEQVMIDVPKQRGGGDSPGLIVQGGSMTLSLAFAGMGAASGGQSSSGNERRSMTVAEGRELLEDAEAEAVLPQELLAKEAVRVAEQEGIVFIDEIDKIVNPSGAVLHGTDPSAEGVQRDLLPLIEGSTVSTKHGPVATDHVLFIASGAFTAAKPSDMMAELQGRLPIRVELRGLTAADFERILTEPESNMIYQQQRLLGCEGVKLEFTPEAIREVAALAEQINKEVENIGARRLHTVLERLVEDISFEAPDKVAAVQGPGGADDTTAADDASTGPASSSSSSGAAASSDAPSQLDLAASVQDGTCGEGFVYTHVIDKQQVRDKLQTLLQQDDLSKYIL